MNPDEIQGLILSEVKGTRSELRGARKDIGVIGERVAKLEGVHAGSLELCERHHEQTAGIEVRTRGLERGFAGLLGKLAALAGLGSLVGGGVVSLIVWWIKN